MNNREIDVLIATHVMGNTVVDFDTTEWLSSDYPYDGPFMQSPSGVIQFVPNYSTDIAMAWSLIEKFPAVQMFQRYMNPERTWEVAWHGDDGRVYFAEAPTAQQATCMALLRAYGVSLEHS